MSTGSKRASGEEARWRQGGDVLTVNEVAETAARQRKAKYDMKTPAAHETPRAKSAFGLRVREGGVAAERAAGWWRWWEWWEWWEWWR